MIKVYPTKIEAVDENDNLIFKLSTFDEFTAEIELKAAISPDMLPELFNAIKTGVDLLDLGPK